MLMQDYGISESFFKEIDTSIKKNCRTQNDVQAYLFMYQGFSSDLMMLMGNLMQWKFRMPADIQKSLALHEQKKLCTMYVPKQYGKLMTYTKRLPQYASTKNVSDFRNNGCQSTYTTLFYWLKKSRNIRTKKRKQNEKRNVIKQKRIVKNSTNSKAEVFYLRFFCYIYANISILTI